MPQAEFYESTVAVEVGSPPGVVPVTKHVGPTMAGELRTEYRWRLKADNGEIIASGEAHTRREDAERAFLGVAHALGKMWQLAGDEIAKSVTDDDVLVWEWARG